MTSAPIGEGKTVELSEDEFRRRADVVWEFGGGAVQTVFPDFVVDKEANHRVAEFLRSKIREAVHDQERAEKLSARGHYLGAKRIVIVDNYFEIYNQPNVHLVDVKESPIQEITETSVKTANGEYELDMLIMATGFDSATGAMLAIDIKGIDGATLKDAWAQGHHTFLGVGVPGFPNMYMINAAGSPGIRSHMMVQAEHHVQWIADFLAYQRDNGLVEVHPSEQAATQWTQHLIDVANTTLMTIDDSQHMGSNVPGKPRVVTSYLGGVARYREICDWVAETFYEGWIQERSDGSHVKHSLRWDGPVGTVSWEQRDSKVGRTANVI